MSGAMLILENQDAAEGYAASILRLDAVLDLKAVSGLHRALLTHRGHALVLDASDVGRLGGQCLQVLLAAVSAWRADGHTLSFHRPSASFVQALDLFGLNFDGGIAKEQLA